MLPYASGPIVRAVDKMLVKMNITFPYGPRPLSSHATAQEVLDFMGEDEYKKYYSFAIVRNPWSWQVSQYEYMRNMPAHHQHDIAKRLDNFDDYIVWRCSNDVRFQYDFVYSRDNERIVDFVGKYENLELDFVHICQHLGLNIELPVINVSKVRPYQEYYSPKTISLIENTFKRDIEAFEYEF